MKKVFAAFAAFALASVTFVQAQDSSIPEGAEQGVGQQGEEDVIILEPSGSDPSTDVPPATDPTAGDATQQQPETKITVSQTFTNQTNSITIIGFVDRPEDKQAVEQALQQALPGKQVNNQLKVSEQAQGEVTEPAGAERPEDAQRESELEEFTPESQPQSQSELESQSSDAQSQP